MKLLWLSDLHLNCVTATRLANFYKEISQAHVDAVVVTGDITEGSDWEQQVREFQSEIQKPVYFVLGNHDYYGHSITQFRQYMQVWPEWLGSREIVPLTSSTALLGRDGWADGGYGDFSMAPLTSPDYSNIDDFKNCGISDRSGIFKIMSEVAKSDSLSLQHCIEKAVADGYKHLVVASHVPPFQQNSLFRGKLNDATLLPLFTNRSLGEMLKACAHQYPTHQFTVLCGHTHSRSHYAFENIRVLTAEVRVGFPCVEAIFEF